MARTVVGLDIGSSGLRAVELTTGRSPQLVRSGSLPLPPGVVDAGAVRNPDQLAQALRRLWHDARLHHRRVVVGISGASVLVRQLELDWMPPADLRKSLRYQVGELLPVAVDDANIDHVLLGEHVTTDEQGQPRRMVRILLVAAARGAVDDLVRCVESAGLQASAADLSALALIRASAYAAQRAEPTTEAVVDVGAEKVTFAIHTAGRPHLVRIAVGLGGAALTRALAEQAGCGLEEAERAKLAGRLPAPEGELALSGHGGTPSVVPPRTPEGVAPAALLDGAHQLLAEMRATIDFHRSSDHEHPPSRLVLVGGGAELTGFAELAGVTLGLPTRRLAAGDVLAGSGGRRHRGGVAGDSSSELVVATGLALGAIG
ncbi:type IV pilus assembly protein PilM [Nocardioides mangrovi]|uniref:Type IV pilus assembly protein PilM n=1 Tax=Nocardioides mangrovi TaxID=2874580 RepID=A0ABS7UID8_9ACTN|nr:type IV pilus assembly protein PilM [Nocardioides mangrovi]MBZ5740801.1 type IV pilus assembly protein PilM [Nocardioides mangrovi]